MGIPTLVRDQKAEWMEARKN